MKFRALAAATAFAALNSVPAMANDKSAASEPLTAQARLEFFAEAEEKMGKGAGIVDRYKQLGSKPSKEFCDQRLRHFEGIVTENLAELQKDAKLKDHPAVVQHAAKVERYKAAVAEGCN